MRILTTLVLFATIVSAQESLDDQIRREYQGIMELLTPPTGTTQMDEKTAQERSAKFRERLDAFCSNWLSRAGKLGGGRFILGRALAQSGRLSDAAEQLGAYIQANPDGQDVQEASLTLATARLDLGQVKEAAALLRGFLQRFPKSPKRPVASYYLALTLRAEGRIDEAVTLLQGLYNELDPPLLNDAHLKTIDFLREAGRIQEARKHLDGLLAKNPDATWLKSVKEQLDWIGKPAPELANVHTWVQGPAIKLQALRGRVVVLVFFADFYEASRRELASLGQLAKSLEGRELSFLGLTKFYRPVARVPRSAQIDIVKKTLATAGALFPVGIAEDFSNHRAYGVRGIPWTVVIDKEGNVRHIAYGASSKGGVPGVRAAIERALK